MGGESAGQRSQRQIKTHPQRKRERGRDRDRQKQSRETETEDREAERWREREVADRDKDKSLPSAKVSGEREESEGVTSRDEFPWQGRE